MAEKGPTREKHDNEKQDSIANLAKNLQLVFSQGIGNKEMQRVPARRFVKPRKHTVKRKTQIKDAPTSNEEASQAITPHDSSLTMAEEACLNNPLPRPC